MPMYDLIRALNLVVVFHAGWDATYRDEERCSPRMLLHILKNFPGIKIVAAHMGGLHIQNEVMEQLAGKADLYFDTAYTADPWMDKATMEKMIRCTARTRYSSAATSRGICRCTSSSSSTASASAPKRKELITGGNAAAAARDLAARGATQTVYITVTLARLVVLRSFYVSVLR